MIRTNQLKPTYSPVCDLTGEELPSAPSYAEALDLANKAGWKLIGKVLVCPTALADMSALVEKHADKVVDIQAPRSR